MTEQEVKELKVAKVKCLQSLLFSTRYYYKKLYKTKFKVLQHHQKLADALERVLYGKCTRLLISMPPRYGKTELAVKNFMAHGLAVSEGRAKFIHLSASSPLALENSEGAKDIVQSLEYQQMFPDVRIKNSTDSKQKWYTTSGGGVYATGAAGQVTGFGAGRTATEEEKKKQEEAEEEQIAAEIDDLLTTIDAKENFGGAIVIDDAIKPDDADADIKRERVNRRWSSTIKSRLNSRTTPVIVIMQRLHPMDLIGYLKKIEPGEWEELCMPALFTNEVGELEALDPSKHTVEDLLKMENNPDPEVRIAYQRQYQQNPKPREGLLFPEDELQLYNPATVKLDELAEYRFAFIDPADEGGDSLSAPVGYLVGNKIYVVDAIHNTKGTDINEPACIQLLKRHQCEAADIESNSAWTIFRKNIKAIMAQDGSDCEIRSIKNSQNKHTRILAQYSFIRAHFIFRSDWQTCGEDYRKFMENLMEYREIQTGTSKNAHDDAPDSCAGMAKYFRTRFAHLWRVTTG